MASKNRNTKGQKGRYRASDLERRHLESELFNLARQHYGLPTVRNSKWQQTEIHLKLFGNASLALLQKGELARDAALGLGAPDEPASSESEATLSSGAEDLVQNQPQPVSKEVSRMEPELSRVPQAGAAQEIQEEEMPTSDCESGSDRSDPELATAIEKMSQGHFEQESWEALRASAADAIFEGFTQIPTKRRSAHIRTRKRPAPTAAGITPEKGEPQASTTGRQFTDSERRSKHDRKVSP